ncbi:15291_t:CDS:2 [Cetraspora pellucida]|uniref:15291_t:CDS:1 n=1 Tax=Cetraspora pellucida TaxID=1433469 RepID=A0A9N9DB21_9GLOM|nr:15291_t:CDS:2 [Cetraspora pellucida]
MPCNVDTIVKVNQVRQSYKEDTKLFVVWAIGAYPVESEDCEMEMVLFISTNHEERDPNSQSIFEKNEYYCGGKVVPRNYNVKLRLKMTVASSTHIMVKRDLGSNRCPLKASLVGVTQEAPREINEENAIVSVSVSDYAGKNYSFIVKTVFPYHNTRFKHLTNNNRLNESVLFVVGQMEVIEKDLYVYAVDVSFVDIEGSQTVPASYRSVRSRLLNVHQSFNEDLSKVVTVKDSDLDKIESEFANDSVIGDSHSSKRVRLEDEIDHIEYVSSCSEFTNECNKEDMNESDEYEGNNTYNNNRETSSLEKIDKGKEKVIQPVIHNTRRRSEMFKGTNSNEKA